MVHALWLQGTGSILMNSAVRGSVVLGFGALARRGRLARQADKGTFPGLPGVRTMKAVATVRARLLTSNRPRRTSILLVHLQSR